MAEDFRTLRADRLVETAEKIACRIQARFPDAGLTAVGTTIIDICRSAGEKAEQIQRPIWWLRILLLLLALATVTASALFAFTLTSEPMERIVRIVQQAGGALVYLGAGVWFLVTLETTWKRYRAIQAIHELRAVAHIIDMHQLAKVPDGDTFAGEVPLTDDLMRVYLQHSTELLAILSKIGQLYVQDFPDGTTLAAVDQFENLATGLSQKIWQKIMILDQDGTAPTT